MNLFGKKKAAPAPKLSESIQKLREAQGNLEKRMKHLEIQMGKAHEEARRKAKAKDMRGAKHELKKKKMIEKQVDLIYGKQSNLEMQILALENASSDKDTLDAMRVGAAALQTAIKPTDVERVDDVMDNINESMAMAEELGQALGQSIGTQYDDAELQAELDEMESELLDDDLLKAPAIPKTALTAPEEQKEAVIPTGTPTARVTEKKAAPKSQEEQELAELMASME
eukprot:gb/GEZN01014603.1/.p1 GENE.gb/GEZN01014603.1/~~gb/GEZN01014603.1/.p1  ORF type:complete len:227 (+),score=71.06 gb/GEZN01014603.1/:79-759(+)